MFIIFITFEDQGMNTRLFAKIHNKM